MPHNNTNSNNNTLHTSRRARPVEQYVACDPFHSSPARSLRDGAKAAPALAVVRRRGRDAPHDLLIGRTAFPSFQRSSTLRNAHALSAAAPATAAANATASIPLPTMPDTNSASYAGAAMLNRLTNKRKTLQMASGLSSHMHKQVEEVVQMEEEQRLLSQAYRGRQKLADQKHEVHPQKQQQQQQTKRQKRLGVSRGSDLPHQSGAAAADQKETTLLGSLMVSPVLLEDGQTEPFAAAALASQVEGISGGLTTTANAEGNGAEAYGVVADGTPDIRRMLQKDTDAKTETLGKMRGMQLAIQELGDEAAAEEERRVALTKYRVVLEDGGYGDDADGVRAPRVPSTAAVSGVGGGGDTNGVDDKLDAIRNIRTAMKDMLDVRHVQASGFTGSSGVGSGLTHGLSGALAMQAWVEQDAEYQPPAPPQTFSTNAVAVTLEYLSNSLACVTRIVDEVCVSTTHRARYERLQLVPHLHSLAKWMAQAEACLETTQRHLRHFHVGEAAVLEGGAFEINSLREQTLMLKEAMTSQDQRVRATEETLAALQHRLEEVTRRCHMWETYLLHRVPDPEAEKKRSASFDALNSSATSKVRRGPPFFSGSHSDASRLPPADTSPSTLLSGAPRVDGGAARTRRVTDVAVNACTDDSSPTLRHAIPGADRRAATGADTLREESGAANQEKADYGTSAVLSPKPLSTAAARATLSDFLPLTSAKAAAAAPTAVAPLPAGAHPRTNASPPVSTASWIDRIERRVAQSWGNPYVKKRLQRRRAEATAATEAVHESPQANGSLLFRASSLSCDEGQLQAAMTTANTTTSGAATAKGRALLSVVASEHTVAYNETRSEHLGSGTTAPSADGSYMAFSSPNSFHPVQSRFRGTPPTSSTTMNAATGTVLMSAADGSAVTMLEQSPVDATLRRNHVSIMQPNPAVPALEFITTNGDRKAIERVPSATRAGVSGRRRSSRAFGSLDGGGGSIAGPSVAELADARALHLLQSLLRSVPKCPSSSAPLSPVSAVDVQNAQVADVGRSPTPQREFAHSDSLTPEGAAPSALPTYDATRGIVVREAARHSMQRLIEYLTVSAAHPAPPRLSISIV